MPQAAAPTSPGDAPLTAAAIIERAPLGAMIRFTDGAPRPPARFRRKLQAWEQRNGIGRLTEKSPAGGTADPQFTLHLGDFGDGDVIILSVRRIFTVTGSSHFTIERLPQPGEALVLTSFRGRDELRHLASDAAHAEAWLETHRYSDARILVVPAAKPTLETV